MSLKSLLLAYGLIATYCDMLKRGHWLSTCFGDRTFAAVATRVWNSLPADLRKAELSYSWFRRSLKTFFSTVRPRRIVNFSVLTAPCRNIRTYLLAYLLSLQAAADSECAASGQSSFRVPRTSHPQPHAALQSCPRSRRLAAAAYLPAPVLHCIRESSPRILWTAACTSSNYFLRCTCKGHYTTFVEFPEMSGNSAKVS